MFGLSYHCGNCDQLASQLARGKCPTCGSTSVVSAGWYQLSVEERTEWLDRINGRRSEVDRYRLDQPGIRERVVLPPLQSCTAAAAQHATMTPARQVVRSEAANPKRGEGERSDQMNPLLLIWVSLMSWLSSLFASENPATEQPPVPQRTDLEPLPVARMTGPVRPRVRPTRPVVWSREHAPRTRVRVLGARIMARHRRNARGIPSPRRRRRLRIA
jgi:hypothetical protein